MSHQVSLTGLIILGILTAGCAGVPEETAADEDVGAAAQPQIDPLRYYIISQGGVPVAMSWRGATSSSPDVEYWVSRPAYAPGAARSFSSTSATCSAFKRQVCGAAWAGSTYYRPVVQQPKLDCAFPPGPCSPSPGAVSFLGNGTYGTLDAIGQPFASTYVSGACEYWSMKHTLSSSASQSPQLPGYSTLGQFEASMCAQSPVPSTWFTVYYEPVSDFCSSPTSC